MQITDSWPKKSIFIQQTNNAKKKYDESISNKYLKY